MNNRYFIIDLTMENMLSMIGKIVGNFQEQRTNLDNTKLLIKLAVGDKNNYPELENCIEFSYEEILEELKKSEWNSNSVIIK